MVCSNTFSAGNLFNILIFAKLINFLSEIRMLSNRAHIYIFGIPNYHRLMPCTRFLGVKRLPAEKVLIHTVFGDAHLSNCHGTGRKSGGNRGGTIHEKSMFTIPFLGESCH